ncbi:hypothetical protein [Streptomyces sp. NPDC060027]|uniref:hypothetical protein n=1 Tax=Streptomyces sp. NPDC060027 TaxID=3347040 RepID=UPI0036908DFE
MKPFQTVPPRIEQADVQLSTLRERMAADVRETVARQQACQLLAEAAAHTASPSDRIAYALDAWLVTHPNAPLATAADYPAWAAEMAARENANREARARKEMT